MWRRRSRRGGPTCAIARPTADAASVHDFVESLPSILAGADLKAVVRALTTARREARAIVWGLGAHVIKTGLSPVLIDLKPSGQHYMEDLDAAGGVPALLAELRDLLHLDCPTVTGETIGERIDRAPAWVDRSVIRARTEPVTLQGGLRKV